MILLRAAWAAAVRASAVGQALLPVFPTPPVRPSRQSPSPPLPNTRLRMAQHTCQRALLRHGASAPAPPPESTVWRGTRRAHPPSKDPPPYRLAVPPTLLCGCHPLFWSGTCFFWSGAPPRRAPRSPRYCPVCLCLCYLCICLFPNHPCVGRPQGWGRALLRPPPCYSLPPPGKPLPQSSTTMPPAPIFVLSAELLSFFALSLRARLPAPTPPPVWAGATLPALVTALKPATDPI